MDSPMAYVGMTQSFYRGRVEESYIEESYRGRNRGE